jgi:hypothetical protein
LDDTWHRDTTEILAISESSRTAKFPVGRAMEDGHMDRG